MPGLIVLAVLAVAAMIAPGCEDSPLSAGKDYTMSIIAQPGSVSIDPTVPDAFVNVTIRATVLNADAVPQQGITVFFSNSGGGTLASGANGVTTDGAGIAEDVLKVTATDSNSIVVTASSASLSESVTVTKNSGGHVPVAAIVAVPSAQQAAGNNVVFDGSASSDADEDDQITMYKWVITSTNPDTGTYAKPNPIVAEGPAISGISFPSGSLTAFHNAQDLTVTLSVTEDPAAPGIFADGGDVDYRAQTTIPYSISAVLCSDNTPPVAQIAGPATQSLSGFPGEDKTFSVDGRLSHDAEGPIDTYVFTCGNGVTVLPGPQPGIGVCTYHVDSTAKNYTITLNVTDRGLGTTEGGQFQCVKQSDPATIQLVVSPSVGF